MFRVVYYSRVSTEEEKQVNALQTQCKENEEFIQKQEDWVLVDKYIDEGKSATTTSGRNDFQRLLSDMQKDKFDIVFMKLIERGWRSDNDWNDFERLLKETSIRLFIKLKNSFYDFRNDADWLSTGIEVKFAEWSSRNLSNKMNVAHQTRMKKGTVVTNGKLWGYNQIEARLEINEAEAKVVRHIFNSYIQGKGFRMIVNELDAMGIKSNSGTSFSLSTLKRMIRQEKYKGTLICGKRHKDFFTHKYEELPESEWIIHENIIPVIIEPDVWEQANKILEGKRKTYEVKDKEIIAGYFTGSYCYSSLIKCGICGKTYYHSKYKTMKHAVWECSAYRMKGKKSNGGCDNLKISHDDLDRIVKEVIFDFWQHKDENIEKVLTMLNVILNDNNDLSDRDNLTKEKIKILNKKEKLIELYSDDLISKAEFKSKNDEYSKRLETIDTELETIAEKSKVILNKKERIMDMKLFLDTSLDSKDSITDDMVKDRVDTIVIYPDHHIKIVLKGNLEVEKSLHNVTTLGQDWTLSDTKNTYQVSVCVKL